MVVEGIVMELLDTKGFLYFISTLKSIRGIGLLVSLLTIGREYILALLSFYMLYLFLAMSTLRIPNMTYYKELFGSLVSRSIITRELNFCHEFCHEFSPTKDILHYNNMFWTSKVARSFSFPYYYK